MSAAFPVLMFNSFGAALSEGDVKANGRDIRLAVMLSVSDLERIGPRTLNAESRCTEPLELCSLNSNRETAVEDVGWLSSVECSKQLEIVAGSCKLNCAVGEVGRQYTAAAWPKYVEQDSGWLKSEEHVALRRFVDPDWPKTETCDPCTTTGEVPYRPPDSFAAQYNAASWLLNPWRRNALVYRLVQSSVERWLPPALGKGGNG